MHFQDWPEWSPSAGPLTVYALISFKFATVHVLGVFWMSGLEEWSHDCLTGHFTGISSGDSMYLVVRALYRSYCSVKSQWQSVKSEWQIAYSRATCPKNCLSLLDRRWWTELYVLHDLKLKTVVPVEAGCIVDDVTPLWKILFLSNRRSVLLSDHSGITVWAILISPQKGCWLRNSWVRP